ncbi:MAG: hypothetical protein RL026_1173 [Pseudomonadota bacterium]
MMTHHIAPRRDPRRWLTLLIVASALFMICVDMTVLYIALPTLARDLPATPTQGLWILNVYALVVAGLLPGLGTLGDRHGHRLLFLVGLAVFGLASLWAALATSAPLLIAARILLGVGGAAMMPATLALIRQAFEDEHERALAIGWWAGIASGGLALGPVIGGALLEHHAWGAVFLVNLPVVAVAALATLFWVRDSGQRRGPPWDLAGSLLLMGALFALVFAIKSVAARPLPWLQWLAAAATCAAFVAAYRRQQRRRAVPLLDLSLLRLPGFAGGVAAAACGTAGIVGIELVLGQHLQLARGLSPLQAGVYLLPAPLGSFLAGPLAGLLLPRHGATPVGAGGLLLAALAGLVLVLAVPADAGVTAGSVLSLGFMGLGIGAAATAASTAIMSGAPPERAGMAASIEEVSYELGSGLGVAVFGSLMALFVTVALQAVGLGAVLLWALTAVWMLAHERGSGGRR